MPTAGRNGALPRKAGADNEQQVVAAMTMTASRVPAARPPRRVARRGERRSRQTQSRRRERRNADGIPRGHRASLPRSFHKQPKRTLGIARSRSLAGSDAADFDGPVAAAERGDGVVVGVAAGKFVGGAAVQVQLQLALLAVGNYNRTFRQSDAGTTFRSGFGQEYAVPACAAGGDVVDVEDHLRESARRKRAAEPERKFAR